MLIYNETVICENSSEDFLLLTSFSFYRVLCYVGFLKVCLALQPIESSFFSLDRKKGSEKRSSLVPASRKK